MIKPKAVFKLMSKMSKDEKAGKKNSNAGGTARLY